MIAAKVKSDSETDLKNETAVRELLIAIGSQIKMQKSGTGFESESDVDISSFLSMLEANKATLTPLFDNNELQSFKKIQESKKGEFFPDSSRYYRIIAPEDKLSVIGEELKSKHEKVISRVFNFPPVFNDPAVRLQYASSFYWSGAGQAGRAVSFDINARNESWMSSAGKVFIHYNPGQGNWMDLEIPLLSRCGNYAAFRYINNQFFYGGDFEFCVKFVEPNGAQHWDNNNGWNYLLRNIDYNLMPDDIYLVSADINSYPCPNWMNCVCNVITGMLRVRDLAYEKNVGIRYSYDGVNWQNNPAYWIQNRGNGLQDWGFNLTQYTNGYAYPEFQLAAFYEDIPSHRWHWDNNFCNNYRLRYSDDHSTVIHLD